MSITWKLLLDLGFKIRFAHTSFKWRNLAHNNATVTVAITGIDNLSGGKRFIYSGKERWEVSNINPYLTHHDIDIIPASRVPKFINLPMDLGVYYSKSRGLILDHEEMALLIANGCSPKLIRKFLGASEHINGTSRYCLWISDHELDEALSVSLIADRIKSVREDRLATTDSAVNKLARKPHQFRERKGDEDQKIFLPIVSSENRKYLTPGLYDKTVVPTNKSFFIANGPFWALAILSSKLHLSWIEAVCGRLEMRLSYSNTLGWNTFPVPSLTEKNKQDLTRCAEDILLARETHFPATIADLYDPENMPENLRSAHDHNDEVLERIYIGRRFKNDTEKLEKLFELYTKMTTTPAARERTS